MNRRSMFGIAAMTALGLSVLSGSVVAQQKSLKDQLIGTWKLVSSDQVRLDGSKVKQFGDNPTGINSFDTNGRFFVLIASADNSKIASSDPKKIASNNPNQANPEEVGGLIPESIAYYGTYSVNEEEKVILLHVDASTFPNLVGTDQRRIITSLTANELRYTNPAAIPGVEIHQVWKRAE